MRGLFSIKCKAKDLSRLIRLEIERRQRAIA